MERIETLTTEVRQMRLDARDLRATLDAHTRAVRRRLRVVVVLLGVLAVLGTLGAWQLHMQVDATRRAGADQRRLCPLVQVLIPRPGEPAPTTPRGVAVAEAARDYADQINCPSPTD